MRRSAPAVNNTGTWGDGWNLTILISPSDGAAKFASRKRSIARVPCVKTLDLEVPDRPLVEDKSSGNPPSSSSSSSDSEEDDRRLLAFVGCNFLRALEAQPGVGLIFSYCLRNRLSYSRPPTASSEGASLSLRSRLSEARDTCNVVSSGSVHAGSLRVFWGVVSSSDAEGGDPASGSLSFSEETSSSDWLASAYSSRSISSSGISFEVDPIPSST